jgi:predicted RNA-binding Zn ribbon-like protein
MADLPDWVPRPESKPAPMPLLLVQSLVNTWDVEAGTDVLAEPSSAHDWLCRAGLLHTSDLPGPDEMETLRSVREGLRALLEANDSGAGGRGPGGSPPAALEALRALAAGGRFRIEVAGDGAVLVVPVGAAATGPGSGSVATGLLSLLLVVRDAQRDGTWTRLKVCRSETCRWAFYDRSHGRRGTWCEMAVCGNRNKNRSFRARQS